MPSVVNFLFFSFFWDLFCHSENDRKEVLVTELVRRGTRSHKSLGFICKSQSHLFDPSSVQDSQSQVAVRAFNIELGNPFLTLYCSVTILI
jgi:hypothetical protein